jgi:NADH-quinone oxidoreductase subunit E
MTVDKHNQDPFSNLYAEWVSAGLKMSVASFAAAAKMMEVSAKSMAKAKTEDAERMQRTASKTGPVASAPVAKQAKPAPKATSPKPIEVAIKAMVPVLHRKGITSPAIVAGWSEFDAKRVDAELNLGGRIMKDNWIGHARGHI